MAEITRHCTDQTSDLEQILQDVPLRWLRPPEVCGILSNYKKYYVTPEPPVKPPAGSLFLFDRKVLRYFRKDGHNWRKKKDGKTVSETHEKLKMGGVDAIHCYYAHAEENEKFQRRIYWMLDVQLDHIVLVHYREVNEGMKLGFSHWLTAADPGSQLGIPISCTMIRSVQSSPSVLASYASNHNTVVHPSQGYILADVTLVHMDDTAGSFELPKENLVSGMKDKSYLPANSSFWVDDHGSSKILITSQTQNLHSDQLNMSDFSSQKISSRLDVDEVRRNVSSRGDTLFTDSQGLIKVLGASNVAPKSSLPIAGLVSDEVGELKKLDSFGRWMDKEIGGDCDDSLLASDSINYWNTLDSASEDREVSSLSRHMQLDTDIAGSSLSQDQLFTIFDFAPDCAFSGVETKVLVTGAFIGDNNVSDGHNWCCMFGEVEVSCEIVSENMLRCQVPLHVPGCVSFYVTCGNRLACSGIREFYYKRPLKITPHLPIGIFPKEMSLQIRLGKMLCLGLDRKWLYCSAVECEKCKIKGKMRTLKNGFEKAGAKLKDVLIEANLGNFKDSMLQNLLKDKLYEWLVSKAHEEGKGLHVLDDEGQGIFHLTSSLGYVWAFGPLIAAGFSPNFRDKRGRTSLHWASYYGREEAVINLIKLDAATGSVDDPTLEFPGGQTAADLASARGHRGIAGYLAEADLTSHLLILSINEDHMGTSDTTIEEEKALVPINWIMDEDISLKGSLAAIRKSAHAASMIQAAFRAHSFRYRQLTTCKNDVFEVSSSLVARGFLNKVQTVAHFEDYLHSSAKKIQHKYRGWKGRKDFLRIRNRIVKLQAHVRGYQIRKHYKRIIWSVSIVEKAILRWRRKKQGLRGFGTGNAGETENFDIDKNDDYDYLRIARQLKVAGVERALARVQSMARHAEARDQYMRLVEKFKNFELNNEKSR